MDYKSFPKHNDARYQTMKGNIVLTYCGLPVEVEIGLSKKAR